jgi:pyrroline-5-carboxylate reductase
MQLGFIGTGEITAAMVRGLCSGGDTSHSIVLSPRNPAIAAELGKQFASVSIASSNQDVVDRCKTVVVALRVAVVRAALSELRFCPDHHVISVASSLSIQTISELVAPATRVTRAVPLPSVAFEWDQQLCIRAIQPLLIFLLSWGPRSL